MKHVFKLVILYLIGFFLFLVGTFIVSSSLFHNVDVSLHNALVLISQIWIAGFGIILYIVTWRLEKDIELNEEEC